MIHWPSVDRRQLLRWTGATASTLGLSGYWAHAAENAVKQGVTESTTQGNPWHAFCDELRKAGDVILRPEAPQDEFNRAEGYRYLTRLLRAGLEQEVECSDPRFPVFYQLSNETVKIGADNPDNIYTNARIDGRLDYRISGRRGTVSYLLLSTKSGGFGRGTGELLHTGEIDSQELKVGADGRVEIIASAEKQNGNWLPMTADTSMLIVRQTFLDRTRETPAELQIQCLSSGNQPAPIDPSGLATQLLAAARFVQSTADIFANWSKRFQAHPNGFTQIGQEVFARAGGDPAIFYAHGYWTLAPDEALVIDIPVTESEFWNFQVDNYWMESLDYRYFTIHLNKRNAHYNEDGSATLVLAHRDPGVPNWLNTAGHSLGTMLYRAVHAANPVYPKARRISLRDVSRAI